MEEEEEDSSKAKVLSWLQDPVEPKFGTVSWEKNKIPQKDQQK